LATEFKESLLIIDESKGRKVAKELGIAISGSLGILVTAKNKGVV
jgi:predicted nucleic acid-binding protein